MARLLRPCLFAVPVVFVAACGGSGDATSPDSATAGAAGVGGGAAGGGGTAGVAGGGGVSAAGKGGAAGKAGSAQAGSGGASAGSGGASAGSAGNAGGMSAGSAGTAGSAGAAGAAHAIQTAFIIVMENHNWSTIKNGNAPYVKSLLSVGAHAEAYKNPPGLHPSEPNYLWLEAGTNFGITDDAGPATNHQSSTKHLARQLKDAGVSWRSYQEDISGKDCPLVSVKGYAPKHNPFVFFDDMTGKNDKADAYCIAHNRPYGELAADLTNDAVARYNFITPNLCHDMHDDCAPLNDGIRQGDDWLAAEVPKILASKAYKSGGALFITWDEGAGGDGPIGMIVLSPFAKVGHASTVPYTHSSTLRTMQEIFSVGPLLGDATKATNLADLFTTFP